MHRFIATIVLVLSLFVVHGQKKNLFRDTLVYIVYEGIQQFEPGIYKKITAMDSSAEKDFCLINWHWQNYLKGVPVNSSLDNILRVTAPYTTKKLEATDINLFMQTISYGFESRCASIQGQSGAALKNLLSGLNHLETISDSETSMEELLLLKGLYHSVIGELRESFLYRALLLSFPDSDKVLGKTILSQLAKSNNPVSRTEALYFSFKISLNLKDDSHAALKYLNELCRQYPKNLIFQTESYLLQKELKLDVSRKNLVDLISRSEQPSDVKTHFLRIIDS